MNFQTDNTEINSLSKSEKYIAILPFIQGIWETEKNLVANLGNTAAVLKQYFQWWWVGFYVVENSELVLGPFQGPVACTRIAKGKGVCGTAWEKEETIVVKNVHEFPGHIACSDASNSEIVVPVFNNNKVVAVLDADSEHLAHFDEIDAAGLKKIADLMGRLWYQK